jgi:hypothetical protein
MRAESLGVRIPPTMRILGISAAFFSIFAGLFLPSLQAQTQVKTSSPRRYIAYVGTYTAKTKSKGIYSS